MKSCVKCGAKGLHSRIPGYLTCQMCGKTHALKVTIVMPEIPPLPNNQGTTPEQRAKRKAYKLAEKERANASVS